MSTVRKPSKFPALGVFLLLLALVGVAWLIDRALRPAADEALAPIAGPARGQQPAMRPMLQTSDDGRCLEPRFNTPARGSDRPAPREWRIADGGDRLQEDACGHIWALWFNSWTIYRHGQTEQVGYLSLSGSTGSIAGLARSGVNSFLPGPGADLWLLGNNGDLAHYRNGAWESLPARPNCGQGQLFLVDAEVWLACGAADPLSLSTWNASAQAWQAVSSIQLNSVLRIAQGPGGLLYAIDGDRIVEYGGGAGADRWQMLADISGATTAFAVGRDHIYHGTSDGLQVFDRRGSLLARVFEGKTITGVAPNDRGGAWVSVAGAGLHYFNGQRWASWRYAQGLPDDEARDVLIDTRGWLWVGGTPSAVLDERTAAARIFELAAPEAMPGLLFDNACAAARAVLGDQAQSGQVAQAESAGQALVFFSGRQVCPFPRQQPSETHLHYRRASDGALLEVPANGSRGYSYCGVPCSEQQRAHFASTWRVIVHAPRARAIAPPSPVPLQSPSDLFLLSRRGDIWLATRTDGVYRHDGNRWHHYGENDGFGPRNIVQAILEDAEGLVWIASSPQYLRDQGRHAGAPLQHWFQGEWRRYTPDDKLADWSAQALAQVPGGVAVGTNGGVSVVKPSGVLTVDTRQSGGRNFINAIAVDTDGMWWLAHGSFGEGLSIGRDGNFSRLTSRAGLFEDALHAIAHDDLGNVWLIAENGKVAVYPRTMLLQRARVP